MVEIMPVMFIPAAVGLLESWGIIKESWFVYIILTLVTTILVMGIAGRVTQYVAKKGVK